MPTPPFAEVDHPSVTAVDLPDRPPQPIGRPGHGDQMDMIGHQAVRQNLNLKGASPFRNKIEVALTVLVMEEGLLASISPLSDVMGKAGCDNTC